MSTNAVLIFLLGVAFVVLIFIICKEQKIHKTDIREILEAASYVAVILTLIYGVYSYTANIYPTFEKESKLKTLEDQNKDLVAKNTSLQDTNEELIRENQNYLARISTIEKENEDIRTDNSDLMGKNTTLQQANEELNMKNLDSQDQISTLKVDIENIKTKNDENFALYQSAIKEVEHINQSQESERGAVHSLIVDVVYQRIDELLNRALYDEMYRNIALQSDVTYRQCILNLIDDVEYANNSIDYATHEVLIKFINSLPVTYLDSNDSSNNTDISMRFLDFFWEQYEFNPNAFSKNLSDYLGYAFSFKESDGSGESE